MWSSNPASRKIPQSGTGGFLPRFLFSGPAPCLYLRGYRGCAEMWTHSRPFARPSRAFIPQCGTNSFRHFPNGSSVGMQFRQFTLEGVNVRSFKFSSRSRRKEAWPVPGCEPRLVTSSPTFHEAADGVEHVQRPAALGDGNFFQRLDALEFFAHFLRRNDDGLIRRRRREETLIPSRFFRWSLVTSSPTAATGDDDFNPRLDRDSAQIEIAADPAGAACGL